jgi:hypothetical protein
MLIPYQPFRWQQSGSSQVKIADRRFRNDISPNRGSPLPYLPAGHCNADSAVHTDQAAPISRVAYACRSDLVEQITQNSRVSNGYLGKRKNTSMHRFVFSGDLDEGKQFDLPLGVSFIGRNPKNDLVLKDPQVSWHNASATVLDDACILEDFESTNGTFVGGSRINYQALKNGHQVAIGPYRLTYEQRSLGNSPASASELTLLTGDRQRYSRFTAPTAGFGSSQPTDTRRTVKDRTRSLIKGMQPASLYQIFPLLGLLRNYTAETLRGDLVAGGTVAAMLIPQGMAYAMLARLPPVMGLYASMLPMVLYAFIGSSRQMSVGPVALDSILVALGVGHLAQAGTDAYITLVLLLVLCIGLLQLLMGITRLGFLVNFLSYPVLVGFTAVAAANRYQRLHQSQET